MARLRWCVGFATVLALLCGASGQARADLTTLSASSDGFLSNGAVSDNGNTLFNNYIAGSFLDQAYRDHFDFQIPVLTGTLTSATRTLVNPPSDILGGGHAGVTRGRASAH